MLITLGDSKGCGFELHSDAGTDNVDDNLIYLNEQLHRTEFLDTKNLETITFVFQSYSAKLMKVEWYDGEGRQILGFISTGNGTVHHQGAGVQTLSHRVCAEFSLGNERHYRVVCSC